MFGDGPLTLYLIENSENTLYVHVLSDGALGLHALSLHVHVYKWAVGH